jgi:hypothetical protein
LPKEKVNDKQGEDIQTTRTKEVNPEFIKSSPRKSGKYDTPMKCRFASRKRQKFTSRNVLKRALAKGAKGAAQKGAHMQATSGSRL